VGPESAQGAAQDRGEDSEAPTWYDPRELTDVPREKAHTEDHDMVSLMSKLTYCDCSRWSYACAVAPHEKMTDHREAHSRREAIRMGEPLCVHWLKCVILEVRVGSACCSVLRGLTKLCEAAEATEAKKSKRRFLPRAAHCSSHLHLRLHLHLHWPWSLHEATGCQSNKLSVGACILRLLTCLYSRVSPQPSQQLSHQCAVLSCMPASHSLPVLIPGDVIL
jgi:hypothetical protein